MQPADPDRAAREPKGKRSRAIGALGARQTARTVVRVGKHVRLRTELDLTPVGLLSIAALTCGILVSTAFLVGTAIRESRRWP
jgi:hypothetical protein